MSSHLRIHKLLEELKLALERAEIPYAFDQDGDELVLRIPVASDQSFGRADLSGRGFDWTEAEKARAVSMAAEDAGPSQIAEALDRPVTEVTRMLWIVLRPRVAQARRVAHLANRSNGAVVSLGARPHVGRRMPGAAGVPPNDDLPQGA